MKREFMFCFFLCLLASALSCVALEVNACLRYWYSENVNPNVPKDTRGVWKVNVDESGLHYKEWSLTNTPPTVAWMKANESNALEFVKSEKSDYEDWDKEQLVLVVKALVRVINKRLPVGNKITKAELVQAINEEM